MILAQAQLNPAEGVTAETLDALDPLVVAGSPYAQQFRTPGGMITQVLNFAFPIAGLILFVMIVWGGFTMLSTAATKKSIDAGKQRIMYALLGYLLLFASYWIVRILEMMFGVNIITY
jgi:hypothetical protein